jgi:hypothetical protein
VLKGGKKTKTSAVLTFAVPPITVTHVESCHEMTMKVDFYLAVYLDSNLLVLPSTANLIYSHMSNPNATFKKMALYILEAMAQRDLPLSQPFLALVGPLEEESDEDFGPLSAPAAKQARRLRQTRRSARMQSEGDAFDADRAKRSSHA